MLGSLNVNEVLNLLVLSLFFGHIQLAGRELGGVAVRGAHLQPLRLPVRISARALQVGKLVVTY